MPRLLVVTAVIAALLAPPAHADGRRFADGNKARGPLDIARISHGHRLGPKGGQLVHTVRFHRAWPVEKLRRQGFVHLDFDLRGNAGGPQERSIWIVYRKGKLVATMYATLGDPPKRLARVALWRPDWRTVRVAFPKTLLRKRPPQRYEWAALSFVDGRHDLCPRRRRGCFDYAPNPDRRRYVKHVL
jgi:hypothetical protein